MVTLILLSFVLPVVLGVGVLSIGWLVRPMRRQSVVEGSVFGVAIGLGLFLSYWSEAGAPVFPPITSDVWIGWIALAIIPISIAFALTGKREFPWVEICSLILGVAIAFLPLTSGLENADGNPKPLFPGMSVATHGVLAFMIAFGCIALIRLQEVRRGATIPIALALSFMGSAACALASGWITMTILFGVLSAISGFGGILTRFGGAPALGRGGAIAAVLMLTILPIATWHKTTPPEDLYWWFWVLLAGAPILLLVCENRAIGKLSATSAFWVRIVVVAIPIAFILIRVIPMIAGESASAEDDMDEMMRMYQ